MKEKTDNKIKPNRYKREDNPPVSLTRKELARYFLRGVRLPLLVCLFSAVVIFCHDAVVQSPFFLIQDVTISGTQKVENKQILALAGLTEPVNIFQVNLSAMEKNIASHPWIEAASVYRSLFFTLAVSIVEQTPMAIARFEKLPDILINTQGVAFKEYDPDQDQIHALPVITGLNLTFSNNRHHFKGPLFNSVFDLLHGEYADTIISINGDENTGITIQVPDIFNQKPMAKNQHVPIRLGFDNYGKKLIRARQISQYIFANIPGKTICAMDLFDIDTVFIKTADMDALHTYIEKGV